MARSKKQTVNDKYDVLVGGGRTTMTATELSEIAKLDAEQRKLALPERTPPPAAIVKHGPGYIGPVHKTTIGIRAASELKDLMASENAKITHAFVQNFMGETLRSFLVREFTHQEANKAGKTVDKYRYHLFTQGSDGSITWRGESRPMGRSEAINPIHFAGLLGSDTMQITVAAKPKVTALEFETPRGLRWDD